MENKKRVIYAEDLMRTIRDDQHIRGSAFARVKQHIDGAATVEDAEVMHGQWEIKWQYERDHTGEYEEWPVATCPFCGHKEYGFAYDKGWSKPYNYCPNCGAKMDGGDVDG